MENRDVREVWHACFFLVFYIEVEDLLYGSLKLLRMVVVVWCLATGIRVSAEITYGISMDNEEWLVYYRAGWSDEISVL